MPSCSLISFRAVLLAFASIPQDGVVRAFLLAVGAAHAPVGEEVPQVGAAAAAAIKRIGRRRANRARRTEFDHLSHLGILPDQN